MGWNDSELKEKVSRITVDDFDYPLPDERIARHPVEPRDACLLLTRTADGELSTNQFTDLPNLLPTDTLLVANDTRVVNARLRMRKPGEGGAQIEVFCLEPSSPSDHALCFASTEPVEWTCLVGNSKRWKQGPLFLEVPSLNCTLRADRVANYGASSTVRLSWDKPGVTMAEVMEAAGEIPVPPYLNRPSEASDSVDYQTVFSHYDGSVAAPTAGLHFTHAVLDALAEKGIEQRRVTLHVGAGTFQPVKSPTIGEHDMHTEAIVVDRALIEELATTNKRIIAVGTTSVRTLESLYHIGRLAMQGRFDGNLPQWAPYEQGEMPPVADAMNALLEWMGDAPHLTAATRLMIAPGYTYRIVKGMITNFHQPRSTLLLLVSAFIGGDDRWKEMYNYALKDPRYRFLSYGDACLLL